MSSTLAPSAAEKPTSVDRSKIKFLLLEGIHESAVKTLRAAGYQNLQLHATALEGQPLLEAIRTPRLSAFCSRTQLTADVLAAADRLLAVGCFCIGTNQVDLDAAKWRGVPVFNAPYSTPAAWPSWSSPSRSCCSVACPNATRSVTWGSGTRPPNALTNSAARPWASSATRHRHSAPWSVIAEP